MIPPHLVPDFDRIAARVANPYSLLGSLEGSDETVDSLAAYVARRAGLPVASVVAVFDACFDSTDEMPTHDDGLDGFEW